MIHKVKDHIVKVFPEVGTCAPSYQHEYLRRKLEQGVEDFWNYFRSQLKNLNFSSQSGSTELHSRLDKMLAFGAEHHRYSIHRNCTTRNL